jgi:hypothetical protein
MEGAARQHLRELNDSYVYTSLRSPKNFSSGLNAPVARLQEMVFRKLDKIEKKGLDLEIEEVPFISELSTELHHLLTVVRTLGPSVIFHSDRV